MNHLHNAIRKCNHQWKRHWGGYLLPKEILALRDFGVKMDQRYIDLAIDWKRNGRGGGLWTYFDLDQGHMEAEFKRIKKGVR